MFERHDQLPRAHDLQVVTCVFNSRRYRSRWRLYEDFVRQVAGSGATLWTVEVAFGDRDFVVTSPDDPRHLRLRTQHELFYKENAINVLVQHMTHALPDWRKVAWVDADVTFLRPDWANETSHLLEHDPLVQMWDRAVNLDRDHRPTTPRVSIARYDSDALGDWTKRKLRYGGPTGWGLAWAARREWWDGVGGLIDWAILGGGDWFQGWAVFGKVAQAAQGRAYHPRYLAKMLTWQRRLESARWAERPLVGNVGVVPGTVAHHFHGPVSGRQYNTRAEVLVRQQFDPDRDLKRDAAGLYQLTDANPELRRAIQRYFAARDEDATS